MDIRTTNVSALYYNEVNIELLYMQKSFIIYMYVLYASLSLHFSLSPLYSYTGTSSDSIPSYRAVSDFRVFAVADKAKAMYSKVYTGLNHTTVLYPTTWMGSRYGALCLVVH